MYYIVYSCTCIATVEITHEIHSHANVSAVDGILQVDSIQFNMTDVCMDIFYVEIIF